MGTVFKALDRMLDISVAIKALNRELVSNEHNLSRLKREVILARKVAHPNVCRIYDIGETDGIHYVSMEYIEGRTLSDILNQRGALPVDEALYVLRQILHALGEAHRSGVVHRDLKPQNIMVDPNGRATMMDFGISFSADAVHLTQTGMMVGTPRYMAPEQFSEQEVDQRADLYSCGVILYEMLTGRAPFDARTPASMMYAHLNTPPRPPSQFLPMIEPQLESIILKALEKNPDRRFENIHEFISALDFKKHPVQDLTPQQQEPAFETMEETTSGSRVFLFACILFVLLAAAGGAAYYFGIFRPQKIAKEQSNQLQTETNEEADTIPTQTATQEDVQVADVPEENVTDIQTQTAVIQPVLRHFSVRSTPEGAAIFIDAQDSGKKTPAEIKFQGNEPHEIQLRLADYESASFTINDQTSEVPIIALTEVIKPGTLTYDGECDWRYQ